ncbi:MAG TPA: VOC family protein [Pyrinomonadaceae bacterium]|jgi:catechol 2,3-dioxygenase-like lactoylglutathione lyase family enzyme|nr:VOC family protein [Pyrinomonadaceae bacterium]
MTLQVLGVNHVNVTVPAALEEATRQFYGEVLGLQQIPKPDGPRKNVGAWYELGGVQLHLSVEDETTNAASNRHICLVVADLAEAERSLRKAGTKIIADPRPVGDTQRFFVRDPGANLIEVTEQTPSETESR